jgi:nicotinamide-nucleotide amidase
MNNTAVIIGELLKRKGLSLATVESATGGLIAKLLTDVPGSSEYFRGSVVSYHNDAKINVVGVKADTVALFGAVSAEVAAEMADGGRRLLDADICLSDTGIAGPGGGSTEKPVGLFYLGLSQAKGTLTRKHLFQGDREAIRLAAAMAALDRLKDILEQA